MTTLIPKHKQNGTGAINRDISNKFNEIPNVSDFDTEANFNTYADTLSTQTDLAVKMPNTQTVRLLSKRLGDVVSVKDFGALGDGTGDTPADTGDDITNAIWNTWDGTPFKTNLAYSPYNVAGSFVPPTAKPFSNTDTWDYIGISLCLWRGGAGKAATYIPAGSYKINLNNARTTYNGLITMRGLEQTIVGDGVYQTNIAPKEDSAFFNTNNPLSNEYYKLITFYRPGGPPSNVRDMAFIGPGNYIQTNTNLTLINCQNTNGFTFRNLWLSTGFRGISQNDSCTDAHITNITSEYLFGATIYNDATSSFDLDFCNFWASAAVPGQAGITSLNFCTVTNTRFIGFQGLSISGTSALISNNYFACGALTTVVGIASGLVNNNYFTGTTTTQFLSVAKDASIVGNYFYNTSDHANINVGDGTASSATNITITANTFIKTDVTVVATNKSILAEQSGVSYTGAATESCIISENTFQGPALTVIGTASIHSNAFSGTYTP
jgi:hypothetical protein